MLNYGADFSSIIYNIFSNKQIYHSDEPYDVIKVMKCTINDVNLSFDKDNRLRKTILKISGHDATKAYTFAAFLNDKDFKKFLLENINEKDVLKGETILFNEFTVKDYVKINQNKLRLLLNTYYVNNYHSVNNSKTNKGLGFLDGFSSGSAKDTAKVYTASLIIDEYRKEIVKDPSVRRTPLQIISDVNAKLLDTLYDRTNSFAEYIISNQDSSKDAKEYAQHYIDTINKLSELIKETNNDNTSIDILQKQINENNDTIKNLIAEYNHAMKSNNVKAAKSIYKKLNNIKSVNESNLRAIKELKENIKKRKAPIAELNRDRYVIAQNLINVYSGEYDDIQRIRLTNFANLVTQSRSNSDSWYFQVFNTKNMTSIIKDFNNIGNIEEFLESENGDTDELTSKYNEHSIDETAKSWEDHLYRSFDQTINGKLKIILSSIPKLSEKYNSTDSIQTLDTNNELGVPTYMDLQHTMVQIYSFGDFSDVQSMITSLETKSNSIKSLYGLGYLINSMKERKDFANFCFVNFAKPIVKKTMITIDNVSNDEGVTFDISNPNAVHLTELVFRMTNKLKATYNNSYEYNDIEVLNSIIKEFKESKKTSKDKEEFSKKLFEIVNKYFPNFNKEVFSNYFDNIPNKKLIDSSQALIINLQNIIRGVQKLKNKINNDELELDAKNKEEFNKFKHDLTVWQDSSEEERANMKKLVEPVRQFINYANYDLTPEIYSGIINFVKQIITYTDSKARLNTANAEGNSASDVIKNCFVSRFFEQINAGTEEDANAGLKNLLSYITQGSENGADNQYSNNPLFFGLKDENGKVISEGLFIKTETGYEINPNAKYLLSYNLFDGAKNNQDNIGTTYEKMSKLDFFITQYNAFNQSLNEITESGKTKKIGNIDTATYSMRIGSDAPKIFFIKAPRYNYNQVRYAFYNHVIDELHMFCKALTSVFTIDHYTNVNGVETPVFKTTKSIQNLIGRALFDEKEARIIKNKKGDDFTKALVKNGRLVGNAFKFNRLFEVNGYNAGASIEQMLSLYGGGNNVGMINADNNGRLVFNPNDTIIWDGTQFVLNLSDEQKKTLKDIVRTWTDNYLIEAKSRTTGFIKVLEDNNIPYSEQTINMFLLNSANMNMNYDDLFEGDYKYYNNARDFLKRTKETQAGGDAYAGYSILEDPRKGLHELKWFDKDEVISINSNKIIGENGLPIRQNVVINGKPLIARNGWKGVTIYNTNKASDYAEQLQKELEQIFINQGMSEDLAKDRSVRIASGYGFSAADRSGDTTKINDAQSYITLEEFIRRKHADGTIQDYAELIEQLLDDTPIEQIDIDKVNAKIQVQKNFYFDKIYNSDTDLFYPRQIKNAEFVLIPKLLPEGSELRKVYDFMQKHDIGQLNTAETSKAAKKDIFTIWDYETGTFNENFEEDFDNHYIEDYYYQYLYKQQDVPQHMKDETNKFAVQIAKKILDNIINESDADNPDRKRLMKLANDYQNAFAVNIEESYFSLLTRLGWEVDIESGELVNINYATTDSDGNPLSEEMIARNRQTLNFDNFYKRAREEAARLGMDSNLIEYFIPDEFGNPKMPNYISLVKTKLESIAQSIFNGSITRQTLPGWHAAQITAVGYSKKLKFDPATGIMEVYLPRWSRLIPKTNNAQEEADLIKQMEEEGLDIHLGYRIPTEGKQSIAVLKVVGFTNDCLGSTIVVPDEWVTQTGSDFDVDSVYGICWEMYATKDKTGKVSLHKIPFKENEIDERSLYIKYVNSQLEDRVTKTDLGDEIEDNVKKLKDKLNNVEQKEKLSEEFNKLQSLRNECYTRLPGWGRGIIKDENAKAKTKENKSSIDLTSVYTEINDKLNKYLIKHKVDDSVRNIVEEYISYQNGLLAILSQQDGLPKFNKDIFKGEKAAIIEEIVNKAKEKYFEDVCKAADEIGILSFNDWSKQDITRKLDRRARNNYIVDKMIEIMNDPTSREEQYGRSNFEKITNGKDGANDIIDKISGESSRKRSPYNPLDQLDFFEDAMGGARLKALSVNWDTFTSKNNRIRASLDNTDAIEVELNVEGVSATDSAITYNLDEIKKSYGDDIQEVENKIILKAKRLGWSNNNRNIVGELVTTYTSQTTAHHLDAVKMGSVPNVDEYTFNVYKLFTTLGLDYEFAIGFIRQPIITNLVQNNNLINSVYFKSSNNPIYMTIIDIAKSLGLKDGKYDINYHTPTYKVLDLLKANVEFVNTFYNLFGVNIQDLSNNKVLALKVPLNKERLFTRIKRDAQNKGNVYENAAFDLAMLLNFRNYKRTAEKLNKLITVTSADKYGAATSLRETRRIIKNVEKLRNDFTLSKNGKSFIDLMYPLDENENIDVESSSYKPIAAIYKYATKTSLDINKQLFVTENDEFAEIEDIIQSRIGHIFTESEYKEYQKYAINYLYNRIAKLLTPLYLDDRGRIVMNEEDINEEEYWNKERSRIYGYGVATDGNLKIKNINNPTAEEIKQFNKLTPAQKVLFIQKNFADDQGIFNYIKVTLLNNTDVKYKGISRQYLAYDDQVNNIETLFSLFINSFSNHNPLIKLATIDLIKYSFVAEGYNFKSSYISKMIPNRVLYSSIENGGIDIIDEIKRKIQDLPKLMLQDNFVDNFVRSHSDITPIIRLPKLPKKVIDKYTGAEVIIGHNITTAFKSLTRIDGLIHIDTMSDNDLLISLIDKLQLEKNPNGYIRINVPINEKETKTILYKVIARNQNYPSFAYKYADYFLIPLNLLDRYENYDYSYNQNYNIYNSSEYYHIVVEDLSEKAFNLRYDKLNNVDDNTSINELNVRKEVNRLVAAEKKPVGNYSANNEYDTNNPTLLIELQETADAYTKGGVDKLIKGIIAHNMSEDNFSTSTYTQLNNSVQLRRIIPEGKTITQEINLEDGSTIKVMIKHLPMSKGLIKAINTDKSYEQVRKDLENSGTLPKHANIYKVAKVIEPLKAATELIEEDEDTRIIPIRTNSDNDVDVVSKSIIDHINYISRNSNDTAADRFMKELEYKRVDRFMKSSRVENRKNIYTAAANYYQSSANHIMNKLDKFVIEDKEYSMDDPELYRVLIEHDEYFPEIAKIILDGLTFGDKIAAIEKLDIFAEDKDTKEAIERIINNIRRVKQNNKLQAAMANLINIYFKKYSTNPNIVRDLVDLRETFGDSSKVESLFLDPFEINSNEAQVILKKVTSIFTKAEMFDAKRNVEDWKKQVSAIESMTGSLDMSHIIDFDNWKLRSKYNENFVKERKAIQERFDLARIKKDDSFEDYKNYVIAKYNKDRFYYENTETYMVDEYWEEDLSMREEAMRKAGDNYYKYLQLMEQLYNAQDTDYESDAEKTTEIKRIKSAISQLYSETDITGSEKSIEEAAKARALKAYREKRKALREKYFDKTEYEGFKENYIRYKNYITQYDAEHPYDSLNQKLENIHYKEAYDWIKNNGILKFSDDAQEKLNSALKILTKRTTTLSKKTIKRLKNVPEAIDINGNIDPRKLTDEQIELLKAEEESELSTMYDDGYGEAILIKEVPSNLPIMVTKGNDEESKRVFASLKYKDNNAKFIIIKRINEILSKAIDRQTNKIDLNILFNDEVVSDEERIELANLYNKLRELRSDELKKYKIRKNKVYTDEVNYEGYLDAFRFYKVNLQNTKHGHQFLNIFTEFDEAGNQVPNTYIYGYKTVNEEFIDHEKTNARDFLNDNVEYVETDYYHIARQEASEKGVEYFEQWFKRNHIYNPYTHKYQPLKIWTKLEAKPNSELANSVDYVGNSNNVETTPKEKYINPNYSNYGDNYSTRKGRFNSSIILSPKEEKMRDLIEETLHKYAKTNRGKRFIGQGYLPRERKIDPTASTIALQTISLVGLSWNTNPSAAYDPTDEYDYANDKEVDIPMLELIKDKTYLDYEYIPGRGTMDSEQYTKVFKDAKARNEERRINNEKIDRALVNRNLKEVMEHFIHNATIFNAKQETKPYLYLLMEDVKRNDAYLVRGIKNNKLTQSNTSSKDDTRYKTVKQEHTEQMIKNITRRLVFDKYYENSSFKAVANLLQNMSSSKYMVGNVYGGIANVTIGKTNIAMEQFAGEYFDTKDIALAEKNYLCYTFNTLASMYSEEANNIYTALMKRFDIVNYDNMTKNKPATDINTIFSELRNFTYSTQGMGEHFMQNTVLLAMLKSHRLYTDRFGVRRIGNFRNYTWDIEQKAMENILEAYPDLKTNYKHYLESIKYNVKEKLDIESGSKDYNRNFLWSIRDSSSKEGMELFKTLSNKYKNERNKLLNEAKKEFYKYDTIEDLFELRDGKAELKEEKIKEFNDKGKNLIGDLETLISEFKSEVVAVNKKIHGVYDRLGAGGIENKWYGGLIMQFRKHIYPGIMKRFRRKGYHSEFRNSIEKGSYITLVEFLATEFTNFNKQVENKQTVTSNKILASTQVILEATLNTFTNACINWGNLAEWEKDNMRRNLGDLFGALASMAIILVMYSKWDDDEIKESEFKSSVIYLADRLYSDSTMFTPFGLVSEAKTAWSSPFAAATGPSDLFSIMEFTTQMLFDPNYNPEYTRGMYAGRNKIDVLLRRQIPGIRNYDRIKYITKQNKYYKVGESNIGINIAKTVGENIHDN